MAYSILATPLTPVADGIAVFTERTNSPMGESAVIVLSVEPKAYKPLGNADDSTPSSHPHCLCCHLTYDVYQLFSTIIAISK